MAEEKETQTLEAARVRLVVVEDEEVPFIRFKAYRYAHKLEIDELSEKLRNGEATEKDDTAYIAGMVADWSFKDGDTGKPIPAGDYMPLSIVQHAQLIAAWREYSRGLWAEVKKTTEDSLPSS